MSARGGISGIGARKPRPRRVWDKATEKVAAEGSRCRVCGSRFAIERAHVIGREHDSKPPVHADFWRPWVVAPDRIVPLCGPVTDPASCHGTQHAKRLDLLPYLTLDEQLQAVADAGSIARAYTLLVPSENPKATSGIGWPE